MYVECTSSSFAVNRENWEGVVDEGREYIPVNEMVVYDLSNSFSVQRYEMSEMFGISTTPPSSPSIRWIAAPIIVFVLLVTLILLLLCSTFILHLIPLHPTDSTSTVSDNLSLSFSGGQREGEKRNVKDETNVNIKTENVKQKEYEEGRRETAMEELRSG